MWKWKIMRANNGGGNMTDKLCDYYNRYCKKFTYKPLHKKLVSEFDKFLVNNKIPLQQSYEYIDEYGDGIPVSRRTQRHYKTQLRRFVEYIYDTNSWEYIEKGLTV